MERCVQDLSSCLTIKDALAFRVEQLWAPVEGPKNPFYRDGVTPGMRNHLAGSFERTNMADFHFEEQVRHICLILSDAISYC
jgi:hypothetical protein